VFAGLDGRQGHVHVQMSKSSTVAVRSMQG
jgi:hypothetical protein